MVNYPPKIEYICTFNGPKITVQNFIDTLKEIPATAKLSSIHLGDNGIFYLNFEKIVGDK